MMKTKHSFLAYTIIAFLLIFGATANTAYAASYIGGTATQDTGAPIAGITVQVEKSGSVIASATTNASGNYTVEVSVTGFMRVRPVSNDHDFQPVSTLLYLYANQTRTNINFVGTFIGAEPATIMGTITEDTGAPLAGITLQVEQNSNVIATTTTDANGDYEVAVDATGDVDVIPVSNAYAFQPENTELYLTENQLFSDIDFVGTYTVPDPASKIKGYASDPCADLSISGATVTLKDGLVPVATTVTDGSGYYEFVDLDSGNYTVEITHNDVAFFPASGSATITGQPNEERTVHFSGLFTSYASKNEHAGITYVSMSGSPTQIGCQHGIMLRSELIELKTATSEMLAGLVSMLEEYTPYDTLNEYLDDWIPYFEQEEVEEMQAIVDATGIANAGNPNGDQPITYYDIVLMNVLPDAGAYGEEHCSGFAAVGSATSDGKLYQGFNWDADSDRADWKAQFEVLGFYQPDGKNSFAGAILPGEIGIYSGMNSEKLSIDSQASGGVHVRRYIGYEPYRPTICTIRKSLENARTINEMIGVLTAPEAFRYRGIIAIISSGRENNMVVSETVGRMSTVRNATNNVIWAANRMLSSYWPELPMARFLLTNLPATVPNDRELVYEALLTNDIYNNGYLGSIDADIAATVISTKTICHNCNGSSVVYVPEDGHLFISSVELAPACGGPYIGFSLNDRGPLP